VRCRARRWRRRFRTRPNTPTGFLAAEVRHYFRTIGLVFGQRDFLRACFWLCAELEADVALARHLRTRTRDGAAWCWADSSGQRTLQLMGGVHPLLEETGAHSSALSITLDGKGAFLSGQNGVGKSTFLRTVGLNLAAARAFGFCYAQRADLPALPVVASMQNEDSLLGGQSLYIAELARARELLAAAAARPIVCLIDEVFRGTNHEEAVSAAAAVVDALAQNALVLVSSHNLVLGPLLAHRLAPWRIVRADDGALGMEAGMLGRTNGVALLAEHGFDGSIQRQAERVAAWLARQRRAQEGAGVPAIEGIAD
jgi:DNA mismatch repair ATPase MutS